MEIPKALALDAILGAASEYAVCADAKKAVLETEPSPNIGVVETLLTQTDTAAVLIQKNGTPRITAVMGVAESALRAEKGGMLSMGELIEVARLMGNMRAITDWYGMSSRPNEILARYIEALRPDRALEERIKDSILSESEMADSASPKLAEIRRDIVRAENSVRERLEHIIRSKAHEKHLQDAVVTMRAGRFVVPVKAEHKNEVDGLVHDISASGATVFIEPAGVVEANNKITQLKYDEEREIERILSEFSAAVADLSQEIRVGYDTVIALDVICARARLAVKQRAVRPSVNERGYLRLVKARHPLIPAERVVPIDIELGGEYDTLIITGPNTGGKTVTLKTAGLLTLMAMCGFLIPAAEHSEVCCCDAVLADIGDEQSIEQSLSTFSGHITNIIKILERASGRSLVLIDELGAGTDPAEGAALAIAILERFRELGAKTLATTHYGELKLYALETDGVCNASCEFDVSSLSPTYRITLGLPGRSNAFLISERLGLPKEIIEQAKLHMSAENLKFEDLISQIDTLKQQLDAKGLEAQQLSDAAARELAEAQEEKKRIIAEAQKTLDNAKENAKQTADEVSRRAYQLMDELKKIEKDRSREGIAAARAVAEKKADELAAMTSGKTAVKHEPLKSVRKGQEVLLVKANTVATVLSAPDKNGMVDIQAGLIKTRVNIKELASASGREKKQERRRTENRVTSVASRSAASEKNLIGMNVDEAIAELDPFIDNAVMAGVPIIYIIHGRGTGALRNGIWSYLKRNSSVKSFRLGVYGEGEDGVTVAELK